MAEMYLSDLANQLKTSNNAALVVGAGISYNAGIPLGYQLPIQFGQNHQSLLNKLGIWNAWQEAVKAPEYSKWSLEEEFVRILVSKFKHSIDLQQSLLDWLITYQPSTGHFAGREVFVGSSSDIHATYIIAWLKRIFNHLITTNWDFLLEWHVEALYDESYATPFEPVTYTFDNGMSCTIDARKLFFLDTLEQDNFFWSPRWDIVANVSDLTNLKRWTRPLWKIHGSPFFLACPQCGGLSRWKRSKLLKVNDPCPDHPDENLLPEIVFWGQGIDEAHPQVWQRVVKRLQRSDLIVASGFSGSGSDRYIRLAIENHPNAWVVNPSEGAWDISKVNFVNATALDLANLLLKEFLVP